MTGLGLTVKPAWQLTNGEYDEILALCSRAYEEDFEQYLAPLDNPVHIIGRVDGIIVSHAAWVERWLEPAGLGLLRTAYIEAVATLPEAQGRGHGGAIMSALPPLLGDFDVAALSPSDPFFYARLGWELWLGELSVRSSFGLIASPDDEAMILRLPKTPAALDVSASLSIDGREGESW